MINLYLRLHCLDSLRLGHPAIESSDSQPSFVSEKQCQVSLASTWALRQNLRTAGCSLGMSSQQGQTLPIWAEIGTISGNGQDVRILAGLIKDSAYSSIGGDRGPLYESEQRG
jgi:hypothetical protein